MVRSDDDDDDCDDIDTDDDAYYDNDFNEYDVIMT